MEVDKVYKELFDSASEALVVSSVEGEIIIANPTAEQMFGYGQGALVGCIIEDLIPMRTRAKHSQHRADFADQPIRRKMGAGRDLLAMKRDGSEFPVEVSLNHIMLDNVTYYMALVSDISERKKIDRALNEKQAELKLINDQLEARIQQRTQELEDSQRLYQIISRNFPNGTINVFDKNLNYVFAESKELFENGITTEKLFGTAYEDRLPEEVKPIVVPKLHAAFEGENSSVDVAIGNRYYILNVVGLRSISGQIEQVLVVEQNITQQKHAEEQVRSALGKEIELNELKGRFVSMASHEFRTPLSTILSSTQLLNKYVEKQAEGMELDSTKFVGHLQKIKGSVSNLTGILNDFLSLDKLESGKVALNLSDFSLHDLLEEVIEELQGMLGDEQAINMVMTRSNLILQLDRAMLKNVLFNLLSNAIKYTVNHQPIQVEVNPSDDRVIIVVIDQGIGIPEEEQKHLFQRFFRAKNATNIEGTGLGLNIVQRYVELMQGTISLSSAVDEGTRVTLDLPFKKTIP